MTYYPYSETCSCGATTTGYGYAGSSATDLDLFRNQHRHIKPPILVPAVERVVVRIPRGAPRLRGTTFRARKQREEPDA